MKHLLLNLICIFLSFSVYSQTENSYIKGEQINRGASCKSDLKISVPLEIDAEMIEITTINRIYNVAEVTGTLKNSGITNITELEIKWQVPGNEIHTTTLNNIVIESQGSYNFTCVDLFFFPLGDYKLDVWISKVNGFVDMNINNDSTSKEIVVVENSIPRVPFFEEFTNCHCGICAGFNNTFNPWCEENADNIALLKYPMFWPALDPYYTEEGGVRKDYYNVIGVPYLMGNGFNIDQHGVEEFFEGASQMPGFLRIVSNYSITGTTININANILPYKDFSSSKLYVAVFEYITTGNVGTNGETEFYNTMMKMVPDASGTFVDFNNMELYQFSESINLESSNVEDYNDLGVVLFIQDTTSNEVYQSAYGLQDFIFSDEARLSEIRVDNISIEGFNPDVYTYNVVLSEGQNCLVPITAFPMEENSYITFFYPDQVPGDVIINVVSEDLTASNNYIVHLALFPNYVPTDVILSGSSLDENLPIGILVGTLTSVDHDVNDTHTYSLVSGEGDTDNFRFSISGNQVRTVETFNYENQSSYSIRVQTDDGNGGVFSKPLVILVNNINDMFISNTTLGSPNCLDETTGSIEFEISEFIPPLSFLWSSGQSTQNLYNVVAGVYTVTMTDGAGMILNEEFTLEPRPIYEGTSVCYLTCDGLHNVIYIDKGFDNYNVDMYNVYRESSSVGTYEKIGQISSTEDSFTDSTVNNMNRSYSYNVSMMDKCGNESSTSTSHSTIHLSINSGPNNEVNLYWSHYLGLSTPKYSIFRKLGEEVTLLQEISSNNNTYTDFPTELNSLYEYYVTFEVEDNCNKIINRKPNDVITIKSNYVSLGGIGSLNEFYSDKLKTYPNPVKNKLYVDLRNIELKIDKVLLYNSNGNVVYTAESKNLNSKILEISVLRNSTGFYNLSICTQLGILHKKIVIVQ